MFEAFRDHVLAVAPAGVTVTVNSLHGGKPSLTPSDHPATLAAARALEAVYGVTPVFIREGGSIPVTAVFEHDLGLPVVLLGFAQPASNAHAPNEWLLVENFERGDARPRAPVGRARDRSGSGSGGRQSGLSTGTPGSTFGSSPAACRVTVRRKPGARMQPTAIAWRRT